MQVIRKRRYWLRTFALALASFVLWGGVANYEPGSDPASCAFASHASCEEVTGLWHAVEMNTTTSTNRRCVFIWSGLFATEEQCRARLLEVAKKRSSDCVVISWVNPPNICFEAVRIAGRLGPAFWALTLFVRVAFLLYAFCAQKGRKQQQSEESKK